MPEAPNNLLSTSTLRILDLLCEGPIKGFVVKNPAMTGIDGRAGDPLMSTLYDDVPVRNFDGSYNYNVSGQGFQFGYTSGTSTQSPISGFDKLENVIPLPSNTRIANPPPTSGPYKALTVSFTTDTYPDANSINVTVRVPALYSTNINDGTVNPTSLSYTIEISLNDGPFVQQGDLNTIVGKCTSPYLQTKNFVLPKTTPANSFYKWKVRVARFSANVMSMNVANETYVDTISVISTSSFSYPNSVLVGTEIAADQFSSVPSRAYEIDGLLVTVPAGYTPTQYSGDGSIISAATYPNVWLGNFTSGVWTNNPAWVFYDILTNKTHGLGNFISADSIDKWTLYQIGQYCDQMVDNGDGSLEPNFTCNVAIQQQSEAYNMILNMASTFRGMVYYANGTISMSQTSDKTPVCAYTNANITSNGFSYADTAKNTRSTVAMVKWTDPYNGYRENVEYIEDTDGILRYGYTTKEIAAFGCTSRGQAHRLGTWTLQTERLLTETVTFQTSLEGLYVRPGDVFGIYDNFRNNGSQGGRIMGFDAFNNSIVLDRPVKLVAGLTYLLSAVIPKFTMEPSGNITGSDQTSLIRNSQVETLVVSTSAINSTGILTTIGGFSSGLYVGTPWVLSTSGTLTGANILTQASYYTCLATAEVEPGVIEVLGLQTNTGINFVTTTGYSSDPYPNNSGDFTSVLPPTNLSLTYITGLLGDNSFYATESVAWNPSISKNVAYYLVSGQNPNAPWSGYNTPNNGTGMSFNCINSGIYNFKVAAISDGGVYSTFISGSLSVGSGNPLGALALSGIVISRGFDSIYFNTGLNKYTGYMGLTPTFHWDIPIDGLGNRVAQSQFITGYRLRLQNYAGNIDYMPKPVYLSGIDSLSYTIPDRMIYTGMTGGINRGFNVLVETMDVYGNISLGASLAVNNPPPRAVLRSGLVSFGSSGSFNYDIQTQPESDLSGYYFWYNSSGVGLVPNTGNYNVLQSLSVGIINTNLTGLNYYVWYAPSDTFGLTGCPIYGPVQMAKITTTDGTTVSNVTASTIPILNPPAAATTLVSLTKTSIGPNVVTASVTITNGNAGTKDTDVFLYRGAAIIATTFISSIPFGTSQTITFNVTDNVAAGTNTYTIKSNGYSGGTPLANDLSGDVNLTVLG